MFVGVAAMIFVHACVGTCLWHGSESCSGHGAQSDREEVDANF